MYDQQHRPLIRPALPPAQPPKTPAFAVVKLTPVETGTLLAFADIQIGRGPRAITVCKWRLIQPEGQQPWLSGPQETWTTDTGERRYTNLFVYPKEWRDGITVAAIAAWEQYRSEGRLPQ